MRRLVAFFTVLSVVGAMGVGGSSASAQIEDGVDALWDLSTSPGTANWDDEQPIEVGVRFRTAEPIDIVGVRFHKGDQNTGVHIGSLWASDGTQLAEGTFEDETAAGWQDMLFDDPVPIVPGEVYVASYFVPFGYYSADNYYFDYEGVTSGPVTALGGTEINGVYHYGSSTEYPTFSYFQSNYWVTPLWRTNAPPSVDAGAGTSGVEGSAIALTGTASDPDDDPLTTTWLIESGPDDGGACTIGDATALATTLTCNDDGVVQVKLTADDGVNEPVADTVEITVGNLPPTLTMAMSAVEPIPVNTAVTVSASVADPGSNDTHACEIDWADGSTTNACSGSHTFTDAGVYTVKMSAADDDGAVATDDQFVIVYDPSAGFVTGGGWIDSPVGAYAPQPDATGKASFGFVSKYKKGATVPTGNTSFNFAAGGFVFHSDQYQWLVVSGNGTANFKGAGTIDGVGNYQFRVWAGDGSPDTFRIRIWEETPQGELVVYDNGTDQQIGAGQIVIHSKK